MVHLYLHFSSQNFQILRESFLFSSATYPKQIATMVSAFIIISALIAIVAIALGAAYTTGALDPVIEKIAVFLFKAKAEAEAKKLQAQGMKEGEDFLKGKLNYLYHCSFTKPFR